MKLLENILNEVGDLKNIKGYEYILKGKDEGSFTIHLNNNEIAVNVIIKRAEDDIKSLFNFPPIIKADQKEMYNVGFLVGGEDTQFEKTNLSILMRILKTVMDISLDLIKKYPNDTIFTFFATSKTGKGFNDSQKMNLYKLIMQKNIPTEYRMGESEFLENKFLYLTKIK